MPKPENTGEEHAERDAGRFASGQSGNPSGRPRGSRNRATIAVEALLEGEADALTRKAVELALDGDTTALRLCLEQLAPTRKDSPITQDLPPINDSTDLLSASAAVLEAVAAGDLTPSEAQAISNLLQGHAKVVETRDILERIARLEARK